MITIQAGYAVVVDDEPANRDFLERLLQMAGFKVSGASSGAEGLAAARAVPELAFALVDQELPDGHGIEVIMKMRAENPEALLIMATMHDDRDLIDRAFAAGIDVFLVKPHGFMELYKRLQEVDSDTSLLRRMVIDQYGPRPYRGPRRSPTTTPSSPSEAPVSTPPAVTAPAGVPDIPVSTVSATSPSNVEAPVTATPVSTPIGAGLPASPDQTVHTEATGNAPTRVDNSGITPAKPPSHLPTNRP